MLKVLYDKNKIDWDGLLYPPKAMFALLLPIVVEQLLNSFMGMADSSILKRL